MYLMKCSELKVVERLMISRSILTEFWVTVVKPGTLTTKLSSVAATQSVGGACWVEVVFAWVGS